MRILLRSVAFLVIWLALVAFGMAVPTLILQGTMTSVTFATIYGAFGLFMGPVVAAIAVVPRFRGRGVGPMRD